MMPVKKERMKKKEDIQKTSGMPNVIKIDSYRSQSTS